MKTFDFNFPPDVIVRGDLYDDPSMVYLSGDVLEIELPNGFTIDLGWDEENEAEPFRIAIYREYFGDRFVEFNVANAEEAAIVLRRLVGLYTGAYVLSSAASTQRELLPGFGAGVARIAASVFACAGATAGLLQTQI